MPHTPPPWEIHYDPLTPGSWAYEISNANCSEEEAHANAVLMESAPELYKALRGLLAKHTLGMEPEEWGKIEKQALAALEKADGRVNA